MVRIDSKLAAGKEFKRLDELLGHWRAGRISYATLLASGVDQAISNYERRSKRGVDRANQASVVSALMDESRELSRYFNAN